MVGVSEFSENELITGLFDFLQIFINKIILAGELKTLELDRVDLH